MSKRLVHIRTYGCQMNEHDALKITALMRAEGYTLTDVPDEADCIIMHTCSIREKPEQKVYSALGRFRRLKKIRPSLVIGVGGCVAQQEGKRLLEKIPHLDFVFGTHHIHDVPRLVKLAKDVGFRACEVNFSERIPSLHLCPDAVPKSVSAYITIMQGCNNFCSYCIVPHVKGGERSRPVDEILLEAEALAAQGIREIQLLGQNVNSYGWGVPEYPSFPQLLEQLHRVEGIVRIRFTTSHPKDLSPDLMEAMARLDKVCEHLHLPVQSGSTRILKRMNRGYTHEEYLNKVEQLREWIPGLALTTDVIVGFPGETEADFEETLSLLEKVQFDGIYSFKFSPRPMTRASQMSGFVPERVKAERLMKVQELQENITASILENCIGRLEEILVEGRSLQRTGQLTGRTRTHRIVHALGDGAALKGHLVKVLIEKCLRHCLLGRIIQEGKEAV
jgi:tRNA-2-methylthio-N6-dimethylallyladenosine synthase